MLSDFATDSSFNILQPFSDWFLQLGLQAASWSTIAIVNHGSMNNYLVI